ncbi:WD repeat-containing protein on Y chromosome-like [Trachinotus anak]|uniref:WD repeat-containing protein on Y chromosome-like n=1 Tax=Trachinotus anak TaxID=443729 RepID=UPI0039F1D644
MEKHTDIVEDQFRKVSMESRTEPISGNKMFSAEDIPEIVRIFEEADADGSGGLDMEEFSVAMKQFYGSVNKDELEVLHMQIDANCDETVDIGELLNFLLDRKTASDRLDFKNQPFPLPFKIIPVDHHKEIVRLLFRPFGDGKEPDHSSNASRTQTRAYQKGQYLSISSDGIFNFWTESFGTIVTIPLNKSNQPLAHNKKMHVTDMVYLEELKQVAISTTDRELSFYNCNEFPDMFVVTNSLIVEDTIVNAMNYWSNGTQAVFSFGDTKGDLYVFISKNVCKYGLFNPSCGETFANNYTRVYVSDLLKNPSEDCLCFRVPLFNDICDQIRYFPSIASFAICGSSSRTMALAALHRPQGQLTKAKSKIKALKLFQSKGDQDFFTCVEYSTSTERLITGGTDGLLRLWVPHNTTRCKLVLKGHAKAITHIMFNHSDKIFVSLSADMNARVWSEEGWMCRQSFQVSGMGRAPISSVCYNTHNNELIFANSNIGKCIGRGTDIFQNMLTSHDKPVCSALYHSIFKQVISVCQNGVVRVWDILTGKTVMQFKVSRDKHMGLTAMSFDEAQRRLITVSQDGKVRLWNFNSGTELAVLPVTVPREVTAIVCINNRMFVSARNSKIIFDLDMEGDAHRFLEHKYLDDVSSLDVHENTLITASSNGNIVIWDADTAKVLYWINGSVSPRTNWPDKRAQGRTGIPADLKKPKNIIDAERIPLHKKSTCLTGAKTTVCTSPLIKCLRTRVVSLGTATLLTSADGYIYAWSVISKGGLIGKFRAVNDEGAVITTMSTDVSEQILLTGDNTGRIYLWDIQRFGIKTQADKGPFENTNGRQVSLCPPPLLGSWQAHSKGVVSVISDPTCKNIITAGLDNNVRLWTDTGSCIGVFGRDQWDSTPFCPEENADQEQAERPRTADTGITEMPFLESPPPSPPISPLPNFQDLFERIDEATAVQQEFPPIRTHAEFYAKVKATRKLSERALAKLDKIANDIDMGVSLQEEDSDADEQGSEDTKKHGCFPPISEKVQITHSQTQSRLHSSQTTLIRGGTDPKQSSPQTAPPYLKWTRSNYGRLVLKPSAPPPCPPKDFIYERAHPNHPKPQPAQTPLTAGCTEATKSLSHSRRSSSTVEQGSEHRTKHPSLPPISRKVQFTHSQTQFKPQPAQTPLTAGCTEATKSSSHSLRSSSAVEQGSEHRTKHPSLPPISRKVQFTHSQTQFKPQPPKTPLTTGCTEATKSSSHSQRSTSTVEQGSEHRAKNLRLPPISGKDELSHSQSQLKPQPPQTPLMRGCTEATKRSPLTQRSASTVMHGSENRVKHLRLPPISGKVQFTHSQTQFKPQPPQTPLMRGCTEATKRSLHTQSSSSTAEQGSEHRTKHPSSLPPISGKVQFTHSQTQFKPQPPQTGLTTGCTEATKRSPLTQRSASTVMHGSEHRVKHLRLPPISGKVQFTNSQTQFKPQPPQTAPPTGRTNTTKSSSRFSRGTY